ncbi:hypothetical protein ElyMa_005783600 [Elysia marginata]|uniref:Transducer of regulated CREB activity middle domain-containing protein n=1 Tax=Elysia marginata TaxID=1093978 RepID=A0AAV4FRE3_9GAST|nr:hypothetical protein ElyMa_005783600 [Elysia marginata]
MLLVQDLQTSIGKQRAIPSEDFTFEWDHSIDTSMESQGYNSPPSPPLHILLPSQAGAAAHFPPTNYSMGNNALGSAGPMGAQAAGGVSSHSLLQTQGVSGENNGCSSRNEQVSPHENNGLVVASGSYHSNNRSPDYISGGAASLTNQAHESEMASREHLAIRSNEDRPDHHRNGDEMYPEQFYNSGNMELHQHQPHPNQHYLQAYNMRYDSGSGNPHMSSIGMYNPSTYMGLPVSGYQPYSGPHAFPNFQSLMRNSPAQIENDVAFNGEASAGHGVTSQHQQIDNSQLSTNNVDSHTASSNAAVTSTPRQPFNRLSPTMNQYHNVPQPYGGHNTTYSFSSSDRS